MVGFFTAYGRLVGLPQLHWVGCHAGLVVFAISMMFSPGANHGLRALTAFTGLPWILYSIFPHEAVFWFAVCHGSLLGAHIYWHLLPNWRPRNWQKWLELIRQK